MTNHCQSLVKRYGMAPTAGGAHDFPGLGVT